MERGPEMVWNRQRHRLLALRCVEHKQEPVVFILPQRPQRPWRPVESNRTLDLQLWLIVTSLFVLAFAIYLILASENRLQTVGGGAYISISAIFLALIGIFHGGTRPHVFVSTYFFVQFFLGALIYGVGSEKREIRYGSVLIFLLALFGTFLEWSSVALIETYEIALVMTFTLLVALRGGGKNA